MQRFDLLILDYTVLIQTDNRLGGKLTPVVEDFTCYVTKDNKPEKITFYLGKPVLLNAIFGLPTIKQ